MRIRLSTYGSRGDVEPIAALGAALMRRGAEAVVYAPPEAEFTRLLARAGVPMVPAFSSVEDWVRKARENAWTLPEMSRVMADAHYSVLPGQSLNVSATLREDKPALTQRWWFWTGVGVVVAGAAITTYALTRPDPERPAINGGGLGWAVRSP